MQGKSLSITLNSIRLTSWVYMLRKGLLPNFGFDPKSEMFLRRNQVSHSPLQIVLQSLTHPNVNQNNKLQTKPHWFCKEFNVHCWIKHIEIWYYYMWEFIFWWKMKLVDCFRPMNKYVIDGIGGRVAPCLRLINHQNFTTWPPCCSYESPSFHLYAYLTDICTCRVVCINKHSQIHLNKK